MKKLLLLLSLLLATNAWADNINFNCEAGGFNDGYGGYWTRFGGFVDYDLVNEVGFDDQMFIQINLDEIEGDHFSIWNAVTNQWSEGAVTDVKENSIKVFFDGSAIGHWEWDRGKGVVINQNYIRDFNYKRTGKYREFTMKISRIATKSSTADRTIFPAELSISPEGLRGYPHFFWCLYVENTKKLQEQQNEYLQRIEKWKELARVAEKNYSKLKRF